MKSLKCPYCGFPVKIDEGKVLQKCEACGSEFALEKEETDEYSKLIDSANEFLEIEEYEKAAEIFEKANKLNPKNYRSWLGLAKAETCDFGLVEEKAIKKVDRYLECANLYADSDEKKIIEKETENYIKIKNQILKVKSNDNVNAKINVAMTVLIFLTLAVCVAINIVYATKSVESMGSKIFDCIILSAIIVVVCGILKIISKKLMSISSKKVAKIILIVATVLICALIIFVDISFAKRI